MSASRASLEQTLTQAWQRKGLLAWSLAPLALLMWLLVGLRRCAYRYGILEGQPLPRPVLVVGNRIAGGAGKTPTTLALLRHLQTQGWQPGVLTRGHGSDAGNELRLLDAAHAGRWTAAQTGDEPMLIWRHTGVPTMVGRDRTAAGRALLAAHPEVDILVCDDGLQHLRLARDIEVVVFDERGGGNGWLLPAGPLREPVHTPSGARNQAAPLVLYNAPEPSTDLPGYLAKRSLAAPQSLVDWAGTLPNVSGSSAKLPQGAAVLALAGIAQPARFFEALQQQGFQVTGVPLPDHAQWDALPWPEGTAHVVVTEKDAVKLDPERIQRERPGTTVWVAALHFEPDPDFWAELDRRLAALTSFR